MTKPLGAFARGLYRSRGCQMQAYMAAFTLMLFSAVGVCTRAADSEPSTFHQSAANHAASVRSGASTPWRDGRLVFDVAGVVRRSNIVLARPNLERTEFMPLGNGRLGAALWSAEGMTLQLNRADTFPGRKSPGQVVIPGLKKLADAKDYTAYLDLYDGRFHESGGGMTATAWIRADKDELVVNVTGSDPAKTQQVELHLWRPRQPVAHASGSIATLSETWRDDTQPGLSGRRFGTLAALTANARQVRATTVNDRAIKLSFLPHRDGSFRIIVAAPQWSGGNAMARARTLLARDAMASDTALQRRHLAWWHQYWHKVGLMKLSSTDGAAQYMENLRAIDLYVSAAEDRSRFPGSNAGVADLFFYNQDRHRWNPAAFWHWNLRMLVAANLGAGAFALNQPYFRLYRENVAPLQTWTKAHMGGRAGICVPETMRFNGNGVDHQKTAKGTEIFSECDAAPAAAWNARTISTGAEVSLWIWRQYLYTGDRRFLEANYPVMSASARFLLAYMKVGPHGHIHTDPSNAHETQWDVSDPTTDIAAMRALFPVVIEAASKLDRDPALVRQLQDASPRILPFPRTDSATHRTLLTAGADALGGDVIGPSYEPAARRHNIENIGLEPVWPYELAGAAAPDLALARRTFDRRLTRDKPQWSEDAVDAARLGLPAALRDNLVAITQAHQLFPSGLAGLFGSKKSPEFGRRAAPYVEQAANVALALQQGLVQVDDGVLEVARAWPNTWNAAGTVFIRGQSKVSVQVRDGAIVAVGLESGSNHAQLIRNPWPGQRIHVLAVASGQDRAARSRAQSSGVLGRAPRRHFEHVMIRTDRDGRQPSQGVLQTSAEVFTLELHRGMAYQIERCDARPVRLPFEPVAGRPAVSSKSLGPVAIGLSAASPPRSAE